MLLLLQRNYQRNQQRNQQRRQRRTQPPERKGFDGYLRRNQQRNVRRRQQRRQRQLFIIIIIKIISFLRGRARARAREMSRKMLKPVQQNRKPIGCENENFRFLPRRSRLACASLPRRLRFARRAQRATVPATAGDVWRFVATMKKNVACCWCELRNLLSLQHVKF